MKYGLVMGMICLCLLTIILSGFTSEAFAGLEGSPVRNRVYPLQERFHLEIMAGALFSQPYIDTNFFALGGGYHFDHVHALKLEGALFMNTDRNERRCIESFFADDEAAGRAGAPAPCDPNMEFESSGAFLKRPAYVPIRQLEKYLLLKYEFSPVYGKAILFRTLMFHLDLFLGAGLGIVHNTFWPLQETTRSGRRILQEGAASNEETGVSGRPEARDLYSPMIQLSFGNRFYFLNLFALSIELRNNSIIGIDGESSFDPILTGLWAGLSILL